MRVFSQIMRGRASRAGQVLLVLALLASGSVWLLTSTRTLPPLKPAGRAFLYPGDWQLRGMRHLQGGRVEFEVLFFRADDELLSHQAKLIEQQRSGETARSFRFQLKPDLNWFELKRGPRSVRFTMTFAPEARYQANASTQAPGGFVSVGLMGLPVAHQNPSRPSDWAADFKDPRLPASLKLPEAKGETALPATTLALAGWLEGKQGWPSDAVVEGDVNTVLAMLESGQGRVWCGNIANIYMLVSQEAGLVTRPLSLMNIHDANLTTSGHVANETYLPSTGRWQLMDFTLGLYGVKAQGVHLNGLEFHQLMSTPGAHLGSLEFQVYDPATHSLRTTDWDGLPAPTRLMVQSFYGNGAQLLYRYHPNVGVARRTFWVRATNRLFDLEQTMVYSPNSPALSAVTWFGVHVVSRWICLTTLLLLPVHWWAARRRGGSHRNRRTPIRRPARRILLPESQHAPLQESHPDELPR